MTAGAPLYDPTPNNLLRATSQRHLAHLAGCLVEIVEGVDAGTTGKYDLRTDAGGDIHVGCHGRIDGDHDDRSAKAVGIAVAPIVEEPVIYENYVENGCCGKATCRRKGRQFSFQSL